MFTFMEAIVFLVYIVLTPANGADRRTTPHFKFRVTPHTAGE